MDTSFLLETSHRPWALPARAWRMAMVWHDLLFAHWPVKKEVLRPLVPRALEIDTFGDEAWIGVVPFRMTGVRHRLMPALPWLSAFAEINVRTYVTAGGRPGVLFLSLDAERLIAVKAARATYSLPYHLAAMRAETRGNFVAYSSRRVAAEAEFVGEYGPSDVVFSARAGTLEHWLTERYCLYTMDRRGRASRADIHHVPWSLQLAEAEITRNSMTRPLGISLPDTRPVLHFARRLDVVAWGLERVV